MKTISTLSILLISIQISYAQENKLWLSLAGGVNYASSDNKANLVGNGTNLQLDAFVPFYRKGWDGTVKGGSFALGINVIGNYASIKNLSPDNSNVESRYQIHNGTLSVDSQLGSKTSASLSGLLGLEGKFSFGKLNVAPSLNAGYLNFKKEGYEQIANASVNGQTRQLDLIRMEDQSSGGFLFKPQVKVGYNLTSNLSVFVSPAIMLGHEVAHTVQQRVPQGGFSDRNVYEASQLANGTWESTTSTSRYQFTEVNFGLSMAFGTKKKAKTAVSSTSGNSRQTPNTSFGQRVEPNQQAVVNNPLYEDKGAQSNNPLHEQKTVVTTPKQTQGKTFGESMAGSLQAGANTVENPSEKATIREFSVTNGVEEAMAKPGNPIGGIIVKGGKNPGGNMITITTNEKGEFEFSAMEQGDYTFTFTVPAKQEVTDFNTTRNNKERGQLVAAPGNPIGGIIVKGGKNPGGSLMSLKANTAGEVTLENLEKGNYLFQVTSPNQAAAKTGGRTYTGGRKNETSGKSISEKGVSGNKPKAKTKVKEKATSGLKDTLKTNV